MPQWEWSIVIDLDTDEAGWEYGGCGFWELMKSRTSWRSRPKLWDLVRRRRWVSTEAREEMLSNAVRIGSPENIDLEAVG